MHWLVYVCNNESILLCVMMCLSGIMHSVQGNAIHTYAYTTGVTYHQLLKDIIIYVACLISLLHPALSTQYSPHTHTHAHTRTHTHTTHTHTHTYTHTHTHTHMYMHTHRNFLKNSKQPIVVTFHCGFEHFFTYVASCNGIPTGR